MFQRFPMLSGRRAVPILLCLAALVGSMACSPEPTTGPDASASADAGGDVGKLPDGGQLAKLTVTSVTPARGGIAGGEQLDIAATGLLPTTKVYLGKNEAAVQWRAGTTHVFVTAPPADKAAVVDVRLENTKANSVTLHAGYTYLDVVTVDAFEPDRGPMTGGTEITVHGTGFRPEDRVLVGFAEALQTKWIDDKTLVARTPPYSATDAMDTAKVLVSVRHSSGVSHAKAAWLYGRAPHLDHVQPAVVGVAGGSVTLVGSGLGNADKVYARGALGSLSPKTVDIGRGAVMPPLTAIDDTAKPGPADVVLTSPYGNDKLSPAFAYIDAAATTVALYGVAPASGPTSGGNDVVLLVAMPDGAEVQQVLFDAAQVPYKQNGASLVASVSAGPEGPVSVTVITSKGQATLQGAYTRYAPVTVEQVDPAVGPVGGGTTVQVRGTGFAKGCTARVGIYLAEIKDISANGKALLLVTPAGSPGSADVEIKCGQQHGVLSNAFGYINGHALINAVSPPSGAVGGGATVKIYGSGFKKGVQFQFGGKPSPGFTIVHSGLVEAKTPSHPAGPVAVDVLDGKDYDTLIDGYNYFEPGSPEGGTWGEMAAGTLNVTVLNIYSREPIEGATVQLGSPGDAVYEKYNGTTDKNGMVVFSGPEIIAPIRVSATKPAFTSSSILHFDATNATLLLFPYTPPSQGNGGGGGQPPASALIQGKVLDLDKYLMIPPSNCLGSTETGDKTCQACQKDADCGGKTDAGTTFRCVDNGAAGTRCLPDCTKANVCTKGFVCSGEASLPGVQVCKPTLGIAKVWCAPTVRDIDGGTDDPKPSKQSNNNALPWDTAPVDELTGSYEMTTRLDELAVACIGGYISNETKKFVPTALGVHRHVFPKPYVNPEDAVTGVDVKLDVSLGRTLQVRLDHPQAFVGSLGGTLQVSSWIDLGSDGLVRLPRYLMPAIGGGSGVQDDVALPYQPVSLPGDLSSAQYTYYAHALFGDTPELGPITQTIHEDLNQPGDTNLRIRHLDATRDDRALGVNLDLTGVVAGPDGKILIAGRNGGIWRGTPKDPILLWLPPVIDPYEPPTAVLAMDGTPTDATLVGAGGLVRHLQGNTVTTEASGTKETLQGVCLGPLGRVAVGTGGALIVDRGQGWATVKSPSAGTNWRAVACTLWGAIAAGDNGAVLRIDLQSDPPVLLPTQAGQTHLRAVAVRNGQIVLAGDVQQGVGPSLFISATGKSWESGWPAGAVTPTYQDLVAIVPLDDGAWLLIDREGGELRWNAKGIADETPERRDLRVRAGALLPDGSAVLVGQPGLWLGPFLTVPVIDKPAPGGGLKGAVEVAWSFLPGPKPSFSRVHVDAGLDPVSGWGFPFWWIYVGPEIDDFVLPDFQKMGIDPFPEMQSGADYAVRVDRGYVPGFSINGFATFDLEFGRWRSRATNYVTVGAP